MDKANKQHGTSTDANGRWSNVINRVWQAQAAAPNPLELVLVGTVLETTALIGEVPTGVMASEGSDRLWTPHVLDDFSLSDT